MAPTHALNLDAIGRRSHERVLARLPDDAPARDGDTLCCPFCGRALVVRRTQLGWIGTRPERAYIDGVQAKCAGAGCGYRPDFDVPIREGAGYWPALPGREEFERERELRDGHRGIDCALDGDADPDTSVRERLTTLGYLPE